MELLLRRFRGQTPTEMPNQKSKAARKKAAHAPVKVVQIAPPRAGRRRPRPAKAARPGSLSVALRAPFSRAAEGVRLPDGNPNTTVTFALTRKFGLGADSTGIIDCVILPCLRTSTFTTRSSISGTTLSLAALGTTVGTRYAPTTVASKVGLGFDTESLSAQYSRFRIVSYGVRLRYQQGISAAGEFTIAVLPLKGLVPPLTSGIPSVVGADGTTLVPGSSYYSGFGPRNTMASYVDALGLPYTAGADDNNALIDVTKLVNVPNHATMSASEVAARGVHVRGLPFEGDARNYKSMAFTAVGLDCMDLALDAGTATNAVQQIGVNYSPWVIGGYESIVIGGTGFAGNTTVAAVEVIYHIEAVPNPQYSLLARPTGAVPVVQPHETLDNVLTSSHRIPRISFSDVVTQAGDALLGDVEGRVMSAGSYGLGSLGGALSRLMLSGV